MTQPHFSATADYNAVVKELQKVQRENAKLEGQLNKLSGAEGKHTKSARQKFDVFEQGKKKVVGLLSGFTSLETATRLIGSAMTFVQEETNKAVDSMKSMLQPGRKISQIANSAEDISAVTKEADRLAAAHGEGRQAVRNVLFAARSEGFSGAVEDIVKYGDIVDIEKSAGVAGQVPGLFGGKLSAMQAVSGTLTAAKASRLDFEKMATALPAAAVGGSAAGASPAETMGALAALAALNKSGEEAANSIKAFGMKLSLSDATKGRGLIGGYETLAAMPEAIYGGKSGTTLVGGRKKFLGESIELNKAYMDIGKSLEEIKRQTAATQADFAATASGGVNTLERQRQFHFGDTTSLEGRQRIEMERLKQAEVNREIVRERGLGLRGTGQQIAQAQMGSRLGTLGTTYQWAGEAGGGLAGLGGAGETGTAVGGGVLAGLWGSMLGGGGGSGAQNAAAVTAASLRTAEATEQLAASNRTSASAETAATLQGQRQR